MEGLETILTRRSIRKYEARHIEKDKIENILKAGMFAPSAHNSQPWEFIVVQDKAVLKDLSVMPFWAMLVDADAAIITAANIKDYKGSYAEFYLQDCAAATQNMLLSAHAQGIGGVWLGLYNIPEKMDVIYKTLNMPEDIIPFSIIALGYPAESKHAHSSFKAEKVHYEKY